MPACASPAGQGYAVPLPGGVEGRMPSARVARPGVRGISPAALEVQRSCTVSAPFRLRRPDAGHSGTAFQLVLPRELASRPCAAIYPIWSICNALATEFAAAVFRELPPPMPRKSDDERLAALSPAVIVPRPRSATSVPKTRKPPAPRTSAARLSPGPWRSNMQLEIPAPSSRGPWSGCSMNMPARKIAPVRRFAAWSLPCPGCREPRRR